MEWKDRQREYITWMATPKDQRNPRTKKALANTLGVNPHTLRTWEGLPGFGDEVRRLADRHFLIDIPPAGFLAEWSELQREHIAWMATPKERRSPRTKLAWANRLGVHRETLWSWERLPGFADEVRHLANRHVLIDMAQVLATLVETATQPHTAPSVAAARTLLDYVRNFPAPISAPVNSTITPELIRQAREMIDQWHREHGTYDQ